MDFTPIGLAVDLVILTVQEHELRILLVPRLVSVAAVVALLGTLLGLISRTLVAEGYAIMPARGVYRLAEGSRLDDTQA